MAGALVVLKASAALPDPEHAIEQISFDDLKQWARSGSILRRILRFTDVRLRTQQIENLHRPFATAVLVRLLSRGACYLEDEAGRQIAVGARTLTRLGLDLLRDWRAKGELLSSVQREIALVAPGPTDRILRLDRSPIYLRTDLVFGLASGGSVGHISGVLNHLDDFGGSPIFVTSDRIPTVRTDVETHVVPPNGRFRDFAELPSLAYNDTVYEQARRILSDREVSFIYQRYSMENLAGLRLARELGVPFALEYNGSEIWINRHWGTPLVYEPLALDIERTNLQGADLVIVVSAAMKDELIARGIEADKVLVNPNGVDPDRYTPQVDGRQVRDRYGIGDELVVGFIGTFGRWHGAEVLAEAFGRLIRERPELRNHARLLMIGEGLGLPETRRIVDELGLSDRAVFTGQTAQVDGPAHLAAADLLVSPHVPNPDGTPFFGSPTKLFEYMAMGKGIVASDLDQIGEVLDHDRTAWLVRPGDPDALATGLAALIDDPVRRDRLGRAARERALNHHTWKQHTSRIVDALRERCA